MGKDLIRCYFLGQAPGWLEWTQNHRRTFPVSTELVCWSSAHIRSGLLEVKQQQVTVDSKRERYLVFESWTLHGSLINFLNILLLEMASTQKRLLLNKLIVPTLSISELLPQFWCLLPPSSRPKFQM